MTSLWQRWREYRSRCEEQKWERHIARGGRVTVTLPASDVTSLQNVMGNDLAITATINREAKDR